MDGCILRMHGINRGFLGILVLKNAQPEILPDEVHALLGENGAGKSTLIKILSGAYGWEGGDIQFNGRGLAPMTPKEALDAGISVIYQEFSLISDLPVCENILVEEEYGWGLLVDHKRIIKEAGGYMKWVGLKIGPKALVRELGVVQKQLVEIVKAISDRVRVLVPDEPIMAIMDEETNTFFGIIRELQKEKIGVVCISYRTSELLEIGDKCTVMYSGEYMGAVKLSETTEDQLTKMMVGRIASSEKIADGTVDMNQVVLKVEKLRHKEFLKDISFKLHKGEILGFTGLMGAGRIEVTKCTIGAYRKDGGTVMYKGETLSDSPSRNIEKEIVYLNEDRKDEGLVFMYSVVGNIALPSLKQLVKPFIHKREMADRTRDYIKSLRIKTHIYLTEAKNLPGRNQQKVVIAKRLYPNVDVYIFNEPTRRIDAGMHDEIYSIMYDLVNQGVFIIMISSNLVEILKMYDRAAVMREGVLETILDNSPDLMQRIILKYMMQGGSQVWRATKRALR